MFIEQPLDRAVALDPAVKPALALLCAREAGDHRRGRRLARRFQGGDRCSAIAAPRTRTARASTSRCTTWRWRALHNERVGRPALFLSAEDLSNLPVVALQADLADGGAARHRPCRAQRPPLFPRPRPSRRSREGRRRWPGTPTSTSGAATRCSCGSADGMLACASLQVAGHGLRGAARHGAPHPARRAGTSRAWDVEE